MQYIPSTVANLEQISCPLRLRFFHLLNGDLNSTYLIGFGGQLNETELITDLPSHLAKKKHMINGSFVTAWPFKSVL